MLTRSSENMFTEDYEFLPKSLNLCLRSCIRASKRTVELSDVHSKCGRVRYFAEQYGRVIYGYEVRDRTELLMLLHI